MFDSDQDVETLLADILREGQVRCSNQDLSDAAWLNPEPPAWDLTRHELLQTQIKRYGSVDALLTNYVELLFRAQMFTDFVRANVGETEEWPVIVYGESDTVMKWVHTHYKRLADITEVMSEV
jgi:hypothetical protein